MKAVMMSDIRLILEEVDAAMKCVIADWEIDPNDVAVIKAKLGVSLSEEAISFDLSADELMWLLQLQRLEPSSTTSSGRLRPRVAMDGLPYKSHTGRELALMLKGRKPLAYFAYLDGEAQAVAIDQPFEQHVASGAIVERSHRLQRRQASDGYVNYVIYTLPEAVWRAEALVMLLEAGQKSGWSEGMERLEGSLLGYEDWQNDAFLEWRAQRQNG